MAEALSSKETLPYVLTGNAARPLLKTFNISHQQNMLTSQYSNGTETFTP